MILKKMICNGDNDNKNKIIKTETFKSHYIVMREKWLIYAESAHCVAWLLIKRNYDINWVMFSNFVLVHQLSKTINYSIATQLHTNHVPIFGAASRRGVFWITICLFNICCCHSIESSKETRKGYHQNKFKSTNSTQLVGPKMYCVCKRKDNSER